jgi:hypothetical protein
MTNTPRNTQTRPEDRIAQQRDTLAFLECWDRGRRLLEQMRHRWFQRRQAAVAPALRRRLRLPGPDLRETQAQQAEAARQQRTQQHALEYQRYNTEIEQGQQGARSATSLYTVRPHFWEPPQQVSFENTFYPVQQGTGMGMRATANFNRAGIGIPNSEVLFLQSRDAGFQNQRLHVLHRHHVTNDTTCRVTAESFRRHRIDPRSHHTPRLTYTRHQGAPSSRC